MSNYPDTITGRVLAVLDHDGIPERRHAAHLRDTCGISETTARRILRGNWKQGRGEIAFRVCKGIDIDYAWLCGLTEFVKWHPRTFIVDFEQKGCPPDIAMSMVKFLTGYVAGHHKARNLASLIKSNQIGLATAARLYASRQ